MKPFPKPGCHTLHVRFSFLHPGEEKSRRVTLDTHETSIKKATEKGWLLRRAYESKFEADAGLTLEDLQVFDNKRAEIKKRSDRYFHSQTGPHWKNLKLFFKTPGDVTYTSLQDYVLFCRKQKNEQGNPRFSDDTIRRHLATLKRGLKHARLSGKSVPNIPDEAWPELEIPKGRTKGKPGASNDFSSKQMFSIISYLSGHAFDTALIMVCTGIRPEEGGSVLFEHFEPRDDMPGCAGRLKVIKGVEDQDRYVGVPFSLLPILERALPLNVDHKKAYHAACKKAGLPPKFGRRDFRAAFASAVGEEDHWASQLALGHYSGVPIRYQNWEEERMAKAALIAWAAFGMDQNPSKLAQSVASKGYFRRRVKNDANLKQPRIA